MSTPNVAGAAALVRQFFREGLWSNGNSSDNQTIDLTATQMRALLIASAKRPDNSRTPDSIIGHGLVDLSTILSFDNRFGVRITPSDNPQIHPKSHIVSKLTVNKEKYANSHSLSVTLAYLDKPIDIDSAYPLFADIDLVVISPKGNKFFGNDLPNKDGEHLSTNEKVIIDGDDLIDGEYEIHLITDSQTSADYSVVAVGPFSNGFLEFYDIQQDDKNQTCGCNECENGFCKCDKLHTGSFCQVDVIQVNNFDLFQVHVLGSSFAYLYVPLKGNVIFNISRPDSPHGNLSYVFYSPEKKLSISNFLYSRSLDEIETQMKIEEVTDDGFYMALFNNHPMPRDFNLFFRGFDKEEMSDAELYGIIGGSIAGAIVGVFLCIVSCCKKVRNFFVQKCCCCCLKKDHDHIQISSDNGIKNELMMDEE